MKMNFLVLSKLLNSSSHLLIAGYSFTFFSLWLLNLHTNSLLNLTLCILLILFILIHHYVFIRVSFDAQLLAIMAEEIKVRNADQEYLDQLTEQLDKSLILLKLMPKNKAERHWSLRLSGCQKLFRFQIAIFITQILLLVFILLYLFLISN